ncbi:XRE family transcriptional regulator [Streptomyces alfalfae]|uniref:Helix-turn-helix domain-containing protein n=1 Tax=Streptomyces alfalfae TaxID=1642299 RepID=A0A1P8THD2_9ACTN|nr:helix-turn-helix transcriptional regulator [Streptomyces alfalfae]AYA17381.1 XRE family transcriptional regulator [Streptomyces fradiae]APY86989.1 transcriptional regulator [Streptomyces alfalfae]QQC90755.1 helix-turn-helix domain-containing protein [Streptomyces alfalfae]QUI33237.1 helix-turn-helix domain-containing protein [Streptomyces alfalfae]RXX37111.1 XRE family transcriptional regulator [Streptomyces alfalfae]
MKDSTATTAAPPTGTELGRYLRARRARVTPAEAGLPAGTGLRRTPGLRREELATLAGVSVDYYTRLERGRETNPSPAVIDALARALRLGGDAHERLRELAELASGRLTEPHPTADDTVRASTLRMLQALAPLPAYVVSRHMYMLAANAPGKALLPGLWDWPAERRNLTRYLFLHPVGRVLYQPWEATVATSVAHLRAVGGTDPDSPRLMSLVGELLLKSPEFGPLWERYDVCERGGGTKSFDHPKVGAMTLTYEVMTLARTGGQRMVVYQAEPDTPDEKAMLGLAPAE